MQEVNTDLESSSPIPPHIARLEIELVQLNEKIEKLKAFIDNSDAYFNLSTAERVLLEVQLPIMQTYAKCLKNRLLIS